MQNIRKNREDLEDLILWDDVFGTWCYRYQLPEMTHMSDDFQVVPFSDNENSEYMKLLSQLEWQTS